MSSSDERKDGEMGLVPLTPDTSDFKPTPGLQTSPGSQVLKAIETEARRGPGATESCPFSFQTLSGALAIWQRISEHLTD